MVIKIRIYLPVMVVVIVRQSPSPALLADLDLLLHGHAQLPGLVSLPVLDLPNLLIIIMSIRLVIRRMTYLLLLVVTTRKSHTAHTFSSYMK